MKRETIKELIQIISTNIANDDAYLGAFYVEQNEAQFIKANKNGILKFVLLLLNTLKDFDFHLEKEDHFATINLKRGKWFDKSSDLSIDWIEPTIKSRQEIEIENKSKNLKVSFQEKYISPIVQYLVFAFIMSSLLVGAFMIIKWIFQFIF